MGETPASPCDSIFVSIEVPFAFPKSHSPKEKKVNRKKKEFI